MNDLLTVIRMELLLFRRGRLYWLVGPFMICGGLLTSAIERFQPWRMWLNEGMLCLLITLVLGITTGSQLQRDRERHLDGVMMSSPISTGVYVWGKYLAGLILLGGFAGLELLIAIIADQLVNRGQYPSLGIWPYLATWTCLTLISLTFAAALPLFIITFTQGQRAASYVVMTVIWIAPLFVQSIPVLFVVWGDIYDIPADPAYQLGVRHINDSTISPALAQQIVHLVQTTIPQDDLTSLFLLNRLLFLSLSVIFVMGAIFFLQRQRQGH